jgi:hypothetical protein
VCEEGVAVHVEGTGVRFAVGATEGVDGWTDGDPFEPAVFEHLLPARTGQPTSNSTGPQINVAHCLDGHRATVGDVGELQYPTWA